MKSIEIKSQGARSIDIADLKPLQGNLKTLSETNYNKLKGEILKLGFSEPISVWIKGKTNFILNGHQRLLTLQRMRGDGYEIPSIPVSIIDAKDDNEAKRKILALTSQYGEMTNDGLSEFLDGTDIDFEEVDLSFRFPELDMDEFKKSLEPEVESSEQDDEVPDEAPAVCKLGDIWKLGDHRLMCGDSTSEANINKLMDGENADITFTSPPYNMGSSAKLRGTNGTGDDSLYKSGGDDKNVNEYLSFINKFTNLSISVSNTAFVNIQMLSGNKTAFIDYLNEFKNELKDILIWNKEFGAPVMSNNTYNSAFEFIIVISRDNNSKRMPVANDFKGVHQNIFTLDNWRKKEDCQSGHGAVFPVSLPEKFINIHAKKTVYEPFCGTGTTLIACEKTKRKCYGMELDPHYCDIIIKRWEDFTGKKAVKQDD